MPLAGPPSPPAAAGTGKPIILHLGDPIVHHLEFYSRLQSHFEFINPPLSDLHRPTFIKHLRERTWGNFSAIMRPFWNTGGEMGKWNGEIIELLPETVKVYASAGAGYDWVDTHALAQHGSSYSSSASLSFFRQRTSCSASRDITMTSENEYRKAYRFIKASSTAMPGGPPRRPSPIPLSGTSSQSSAT